MGRKALPQEFYCSYCKRTHVETEFYKTANPFYPDGRTLFCKDAIKTVFNYYFKQTQNMETALWLTCSQIGVPFIRKAYDMFEEDLKKRKRNADYNYVGLYLAKLQLLDTNGENKKYKDFSMTDVAYNEINSLRIAEEAVKADYQKFELDWGKKDIEEYEFLEYRYDVYTNGITLTPAQETLYRQLCHLELRKRKKENEDESTKEEQALILNIMSKLKIDNFSDNKDKSEEEKLIEYQCYLQEKHDPAELYDKDEYKDMCNIGSTWEDIKRSLKNLLVGSREYPEIIE